MTSARSHPGRQRSSSAVPERNLARVCWRAAALPVVAGLILTGCSPVDITVDSGARLQGTVQISDGSIDQINLPDDFASEEPKK